MFRLLLVEDEYIEREAMKHIIGQRFEKKFEIKEAANGLEAIEEARIFKPDIIFLDIKMPGCSGIEAARQIREFLPDANMIFITAYDHFDYAKEAISLRVDEFLLKPVDVDEVCRYIERMINKLEEEKLKRSDREKNEHEFSMIKKKFQLEFKELLLDYDASEESIKHYLEIMDIKMGQAVIGLFDFTTIEKYESISSIQKEFMKERFVKKLELRCEQKGIKIIIGDLKDLLTVVFIIEEYEDLEKLSVLGQQISECISTLDMSIAYQLSESIKSEGDIPKVLYKEKQKLFALSKKENKVYPFELEDKVVELIRRKEYKEARQYIVKIADELKSAYDYAEFKKELQGLYTMVERAIRRSSPDLLLQNADRMVSEVTTYSEMIHFYDHLFGYAEEIINQMPDKNKILMEKICKYLEEHYNEDISLEEAASMIGFSSFYFTKLMKEHMNMSYIDYVTSLRIEKAKQLLEETDMTVKDVGIAVGYENANYFTRVFKRVEGGAPSQYKSKFVN